MKGYFSRIANQSGLRYSEQNAQTHALSGGKRADGVTPIEREETVFVPPPIQVNKAQAAIETDRADKLQTRPQQEPTETTEQRQKPPVREEISAQMPEKRGTKIVLKETQTVSEPVENTANQPPILGGNKIEQYSASGGFSIIEQTVFNKSGLSDEANKQTPNRDQIEPEEIEEVKPSEPRSVLEAEKKEYLTRTAAIIEKGEFGSADIQTILFQEVQDWVAASPVSARVVKADAEDLETVVITEVAQAKEPGIVTIRDSILPERAEHIGPMEQSFELSIGTISVIIEESKKQHQPEPPTQQNNKASVQENGFGFSRLNRSYL